jgi:anthranilate phosphoribosyltransferase
MGVRTFFNMLGPMVNPAFPKKQLVGVFSLELQRYYKYIYEKEDISYRIVHSLDGYDEISLTGNAKIISPETERIFRPEEVTTHKITQASLYGGNDVASSAKLFMEILDGKGSFEQNIVVATNAAMAIQCSQPEKTLDESLSMAFESLESGQAKNALQTLLSL